MTDTTIRLDKFLSNAGIVARRGVKKFLKEHDVTVDGKRVTESGERVNLNKQTILIDGKKMRKPEFVYFLLNKPIGIISTTSDEFARDTVTSLIDTNERIYPVGRLDKDSHGLVLLTNDGELTHQLIHPKYHVPKIYRIIVAGHPTASQLEKMRMGVMLHDGITMPAEVMVVSEPKHVISNNVRDLGEISRLAQNDNSKKKPVIPDLIGDPGKTVDSHYRGNDKERTTIQITLHEGRNRQIRRMCEEVGLNLLDLQRISFGPLQLGELKKGEYRALTKKEIEALRQAVKKPHV